MNPSSTPLLFTIITASFKRPELLRRCVASVQAQTYPFWRMIIINDDSEGGYREIEKEIEAIPNIVYLKNFKNVGKNASVNRAFEVLRQEQFDGYIIFLDDDDWFSKESLGNLKDVLVEKNLPTWLVTNRVQEDGVSLTQNSTKRESIRYYFDYLLTRRFKGDATHSLRFKEVSYCVFPTCIKNAEEWIYFSQVALISPTFCYVDIPTTYTKGYPEGGLTDITRFSLKAHLKQLRTISHELNAIKLWNVNTVSYFALRFLYSFLKSFKGVLLLAGKTDWGSTRARLLE
jgi:glycosyltransferase involved in cell wall biosynthesis